MSAVTFEEAVRRVLGAPETGRRLSAHFCSANMIVEASRNPTLQVALNGAELVAPDGMPMVWLGRMRGYPVERVCGPDFMPAILDRSRAAGRRHFFYGGAEGVSSRLATLMEGRFPGLQVAGAYSPPFRDLTKEEDDEVTDRINAARPDYVWVGLSTPKQDLWVFEHRQRLRSSAVLAVGAAFDFLAGRQGRAPRWMQRTGMEWSFRLLSEPQRLGRRYTLTNIQFIAIVCADAMRSLGGRAARHR